MMNRLYLPFVKIGIHFTGCDSKPDYYITGTKRLNSMAVLED